MTWSAEPYLSEGFRWRCRRRVAGNRCHGSASIRHGSWFQKSNLTLQEIVHITYNILCREPALNIQNEYCLGDTQTGACFAGKPCWSFCRAAQKRSVVLTRPSKLTRACSDGEFIIEGTLLRVSGCLVVLNESLAEHFLFPYRIDLLTH